MIGNIGTTGFILIILIALLLFGPSKLPELGRAFGRTLREFKEGARNVMDDDEAKRKEVSASEQLESEAKGAELVNRSSDKRLPE